MKAEDLADTLHRKMKPIQDAVESEQLRKQLSKRLEYAHRKSASAGDPLLSGDRVICGTVSFVLSPNEWFQGFERNADMGWESLKIKNQMGVDIVWPERR